MNPLVPHIPMAEMFRLIAADSLERRLRPLAAMLADPDHAPHTPASPGELAEQRHLLYDADPDSAVPAFPYPNLTPEEAV